MTQEELAIQLPNLKLRIPYDEALFNSNEEYELVLTTLLDDSKAYLMNKLFPFKELSLEEYVIPANRYNWQLRCCVELINIADKMGYTSYAENDISWTKLSDGLSYSLQNEVISNVGIPKRKTFEVVEEVEEPINETNEEQNEEPIDNNENNEENNTNEG